MQNPVQRTKAIDPIRNSLNRSPWRRGFLLIPLAFTAACLALSPQARAVCQEGCGTSNHNTFLGDDALISNTTGSDNTAIGDGALASNTIGSGNTASGDEALVFNTTGSNNTANGVAALLLNKSGSDNTAIGYVALNQNYTGKDNTAAGASALVSNSIGNFNTATGYQALYYNTIGNANTANGVSALQTNSSGNNNTANGVSALLNNSTGSFNTANGWQSLYGNTTGYDNTADGVFALSSNTTGGNNTATGFHAFAGNTTGSNNIALGVLAGSALTTGSNNIEIGNIGVTGESGRIRIGKVGTQSATFVAGISGVTVAGGVTVVVDSNGQLGTVTSSARFKDKVQPMDKASEAILSLHPVTFRYKHELDPEDIPQFGLVAEEVEKVSPDLVARDGQGKPYTVRYEAVNAMLLNEFLKEHRKVAEQNRKVEELEATVGQLKSTVVQQKDLQAIVAQQEYEIKTLTASLKQQASQIQKVSDRLEVSKPAARVVANN
jgi:hypothetical protein